MRPGHWVGVSLIATALAADVVLIRRDHEPISTVVRRSVVARTVVAYLAAHLLLEIPGDPLTALGRKVQRG